MLFCSYLLSLVNTNMLQNEAGEIITDSRFPSLFFHRSFSCFCAYPVGLSQSEFSDLYHSLKLKKNC